MPWGGGGGWVGGVSRHLTGYNPPARFAFIKVKSSTSLQGEGGVSRNNDRRMVRETFRLAASRHARALGVRIPCENVVVNVSSWFAEMP